MKKQPKNLDLAKLLDRKLKKVATKDNLKKLATKKELQNVTKRLEGRIDDVDRKLWMTEQRFDEKLENKFV